MRLTPVVRRVLALSSLALCVIIAVLFASGIVPTADTKPAGTLGINNVTKSVAEVSGLSDGDGKADPGETLEYTISITGNASPTTGVTLNDTLSSLTTLSGTANILPIVKGESFTAVGNTLMVIPDGSGDLLSNDMDLDGGTLEVDGFGVNASATNAPGETYVTIANGGSVRVRANGSFDYDPPKGVNTAGTFYYRVKDGQGGTGVAQVNLTTTGMIWYVNPSAAVNGDGRFSTPFNSLPSFNAANAGAGATDALPQNSDAIFLYSGAHAGPLNLRGGQKLIGQGASATIAAIAGYPAPSGTSQLPATGGASPTITSTGIGVTLGNNVTIRGITIGNTTGAKLSGGSFGTLVIGNNVSPDVTLNGTGQAMNLGGGTFDPSSGFVSVTSTSSTTSSISLVGIGGSVSFGSGTISGSTSGATFLVSAGSVSITYIGNITHTTANQPALSVDGGHNGTLTFNTGTISATNGTGLQFNDADGTYNFNGTTTLSGGDAGIDILNGSTGTFSFGTGTSITNPTGDAFNLEGTTASNANVTYSGSISKNNSGFLIDIDNHDANTITFQTGVLSSTGTSNGIRIQNSNGGTINFNNPTKTLNTGGSNAVTLSSNSGKTISFGNGGLAITTTTGTGFSVSGGAGSVTVGTGSSANTVSASGGTAVSIAGVSSASRTPLNIQFTSVSSNGGANGINLQNTSSIGSPGGFRILGNSAGLCGGVSNPTGSATAPNAADCTGGTIQNTTGADGATSGNGIYLSNVENVSLTRIRVNDHQNNGIFGTGVRGLTIASSLFNGNNGNSNSGAFDESAINMTDLGGTVSITNSFISGGAFNNLRIENTTGTAPILSLTVSGNTSGTMQGSTADVRSTAFLVHAMDGTLASQIHNNRLTVWWGNAIHVIIQGTASGTSNITGNFADNTNGALAGAGGIWVGGGTHTYNISNNIVRHTNGTAISADRVNFGTTMQGTIDNNTIGVSGDNNSGSVAGAGIFASHHGPGTTTVRISNNVIRQVAGQAAAVIWLLSGDAAGFGGSGIFNATVVGNNMQQTGSPSIAAHMGILVTHGTQSGPPNDTDQGCYDIGGSTAALRNSITNINTGFGFAATSENRIRVNQRFGTTSRWPGFAGTQLGVASQTDLAAYLLSRNTASNSTNANTSTGGFLNTTPAGSACPQPANPPPSFAETDIVNDQASSTEFYGSGSIDAELSESFVGQEFNGPIVASLERGAADLEIELVEVASATNASFTRTLSEFAGKLGNMISPAASAAPVFAGETVTKGPFTLPANETVTIKFRVTVEGGPYAAGVNDITNTANITADAGINIPSNTTSIELDAAPELSVTVAANPATTEPGSTLAFVTTYANGNSANAQGATGVTVTQTVPANTTFNAAASGAGWSCADGSPAGTTCSYSVGSMAVNSSAALNFAVDVLPALPAGAISIIDSASIADDGANGTDLDGSDNDSDIVTTPIIGNWLGATSTDWHVASNWSNNTVPPSGNNISVPNVANRPEIISQDATVGLLTLSRNMTIGTGRTLNAGGNVTLGTNVIDGAGTLELAASAEISRTTGQVESAMKKNFAAPGAFVFPVGTTGAYSPVNVNVTAGTGSLSVRANTGTVPSTPPVDPAKTLQRFWSLDGSGITADLTFNYLQTDVAGTEGAYRLLRVAGGVPQSFANAAGCPASGSPCVDPTANTIFAAGVSTFSDWTASEIAPTAAPVAITGQVIGYEGRGNSGALVMLTDEAGNIRYTKANTFGYFRFVDIEAGRSYVISVRDKRHRYTASIVNLDADVAGLLLVPEQK